MSNKTAQINIKRNKRKPSQKVKAAFDRNNDYLTSVNGQRNRTSSPLS